MALTVNTNVSALKAQRDIGVSERDGVVERLASGKRINSAVDDAAGLAIAARMESQISASTRRSGTPTTRSANRRGRAPGNDRDPSADP